MSLTVLVADDDYGIRVAIADYLELAGYLVTMAADGQEALNKLQAEMPHLLIADISMPHLTGYELVQQIRRQPMFRLLPVIFLTERTAVEDRIRGYEVGGDVYLPKPFELQELGVIVRSLLERSQLIESEWRIRMQIMAQQQPSGTDTAVQNTPPSAAPSSAAPPSAAPPPSPVPPPSISPPPVPTPSPTEVIEATSIPSEETIPSPSPVPSNKPLSLTTLTQREQDVLTFVVQGFSNGQIGEALHLSPRTIEKYVSRLLQKTQTRNRAELLRFAMDHDLVQHER